MDSKLLKRVWFFENKLNWNDGLWKNNLRKINSKEI
jgi:hypothetical protein